jgi:hypothetical protein
MKFRYAIEVYPEIVFLQSHFLPFSTICNINMADEQTCEVRSIPAPLRIGPCYNVWYESDSVNKVKYHMNTAILTTDCQ